MSPLGPSHADRTMGTELPGGGLQAASQQPARAPRTTLGCLDSCTDAFATELSGSRTTGWKQPAFYLWDTFLSDFAAESMSGTWSAQHQLRAFDLWNIGVASFADEDPSDSLLAAFLQRTADGESAQFVVTIIAWCSGSPAAYRKQLTFDLSGLCDADCGILSSSLSGADIQRAVLQRRTDVFGITQVADAIAGTRNGSTRRRALAAATTLRRGSCGPVEAARSRVVGSVPGPPEGLYPGAGALTRGKHGVSVTWLGAPRGDVAETRPSGRGRRSVARLLLAATMPRSERRRPMQRPCEYRCGGTACCWKGSYRHNRRCRPLALLGSEQVRPVRRPCEPRCCEADCYWKVSYVRHQRSRQIALLRLERRRQMRCPCESRCGDAGCYREGSYLRHRRCRPGALLWFERRRSMRRPCESRCSDPGCCWKGSYLRRRCRPSDGSAGPYWQSEARIGEAAVPGPPLSTIDDPDGDCLDEECFDLPGQMSSNDEGGVDEPEPSRPRAQGDRPGLAHEWSVLPELVGSSEESGLDEPEPPRRRMQLPEQGSRPARKTKKAARTNCGEFCLSCKESCVKFAGARPGFAFKTGMSGVGYYPDGGGAVACADGLAQNPSI